MNNDSDSDSHVLCPRCPKVSSVESPYCARCLADRLAEGEKPQPPCEHCEQKPSTTDRVVQCCEREQYCRCDGPATIRLCDVCAERHDQYIQQRIAETDADEDTGKERRFSCEGNVNCTNYTNGKPPICAMCANGDFQESFTIFDGNINSDGEEYLGNAEVEEPTHFEKCEHCEKQLSTEEPHPHEKCCGCGNKSYCYPHHMPIKHLCPDCATVYAQLTKQLAAQRDAEDAQAAAEAKINAAGADPISDGDEDTGDANWNRRNGDKVRELYGDKDKWSCCCK